MALLSTQRSQTPQPPLRQTHHHLLVPHQYLGPFPSCLAPGPASQIHPPWSIWSRRTWSGTSGNCPAVVEGGLGAWIGVQTQTHQLIAGPSQHSSYSGAWQQGPRSLARSSWPNKCTYCRCDPLSCEFTASLESVFSILLCPALKVSCGTIFARIWSSGTVPPW